MNRLAQIADSDRKTKALRVTYEDGRGILRQILSACTSRDFKVAEVKVDRPEGGAQDGNPGAVVVALEIHGRGLVAELAAALGEIGGS